MTIYKTKVLLCFISSCCYYFIHRGQWTKNTSNFTFHTKPKQRFRSILENKMNMNSTIKDSYCMKNRSSKFTQKFNYTVATQAGQQHDGLQRSNPYPNFFTRYIVINTRLYLLKPFILRESKFGTHSQVLHSLPTSN